MWWWIVGGVGVLGVVLVVASGIVAWVMTKLVGVLDKDFWE